MCSGGDVVAEGVLVVLGSVVDRRFYCRRELNL